MDNSISQGGVATSDLQHYPFQEPGTRLQLPGPGFRFYVSKENDNAMTHTHPITQYFYNENSTSRIRNRKKSKSSHKRCKGRPKLHFSSVMSAKTGYQLPGFGTG